MKHILRAIYLVYTVVSNPEVSFILREILKVLKTCKHTKQEKKYLISVLNEANKSCEKNRK